MDSVAVIAAAARNVDITFVMAWQSARFLLVLPRWAKRSQAGGAKRQGLIRAIQCRSNSRKSARRLQSGIA